MNKFTLVDVFKAAIMFTGVVYMAVLFGDNNQFTLIKITLWDIFFVGCAILVTLEQILQEMKNK